MDLNDFHSNNLNLLSSYSVCSYLRVLDGFRTKLTNDLMAQGSETQVKMECLQVQETPTKMAWQGACLQTASQKLAPETVCSN